ncbi:MAG: sarcosine oxidase subunit gamma [Woeseiaceae bacterium]|nr:sarcosine oxidase subunit gamma [Woeseiaceae bacterium]
MSEAAWSRHGLEPFLGAATRQAADDKGLRITVRGDLGHVNLRGAATDPKFVSAVEGVIQQPLPLTPNTMSQDAHRVFWLGPDEWLVAAAAQQAAGIVQGLQQATSQMHASVNDLSGGQVALMLEGQGAHDLLAKGCTLDLHPQVFRTGDCAQSGLGRANILLGAVDDAPTFIIVVRRSFSDYLCRWLAEAGQESAIAFSAS